LAIEQVAASLAYMTIRQLRIQLGEHFNVKKFDAVGVPDRQQTMEAAIDWSIQLLTEEEKRLFLLLSVFDGGWASNAAEFVCCESMSGSADISQILELLASGSLVSYSRAGARYRMLEPIRQYAAERLPASDLQGLRDRHFEWFYNIAILAKAAGLEADDSRHYKTLNADYDNLRRALAWGLTRQEFAIKTVELCNALYRFWLRKGLIREGTTWIQQSMDTTPDMPEQIRAESLLWLGVLQWQGKNYGAADKALQSSYDVFTALHDEQNAARAYGNMGLVAFAQCHYAVAKQKFERVIPVFEKFGNFGSLASTVENLGVCQSELGDFNEAEESLKRSIFLHRDMKSSSALSKAIDSLLGNYEKMGELLNHKEKFLEGAEIALTENEIFLIENYLESGCLFCKHLGEFELGTQAIGGLEMAVEESQRVLVPAQESLREDLRSFFAAQIGERRYRRALLDGRGLGARTMLRMVCRMAEGED
jgi:tetratricopeptide (TPR) repeat protein